MNTIDMNIIHFGEEIPVLEIKVNKLGCLVYEIMGSLWNHALLYQIIDIVQIYYLICSFPKSGVRFLPLINDLGKKNPQDCSWGYSLDFD